ncbi:MAG: hypothetical protein GY940_29185 [bacterium]|nr:hypothetical protein [bacterium]
MTMTGKKSAVSRRIFLKQSSTLGILGTLWSTGYAFGNPTTTKTKKGKRIRLPEAGPMIPPVPAILLTVNGNNANNGKPGQVDDISVVWTFVVNGKPPQIGISVADYHVCGAFIKMHGEFVLNVPTVEMVTPFDTVDMSSDKVADKFALSGLTRGKAVKVNATTVHHGVCDNKGRLIVPRVPFFGMTAGSGEFYTMGKKAGHIGMTKGRTDIKY